ncbi:rho guanine nucleotide exchange factor 28 isoform X1 [Mauremys reevesii]|uniref:rho guanine nucleotide exchange factor 28 isoform X1 n=5 Tax=Mauremys reevesii TaxID=260615 RepID=UPI00193F54B8|nr:rho guanine nucleotide exchange factor 28 isoform X1 [Mauremys reevesii]XP_039400637.1 rho guanine nucleotide exchange factor 28 isoform X1 [Mauremys reevesii]
MKLSCTEVPLYGQMTVYAKFDKDIYLPEDAECYFVYSGSTQRHITFAERINDSALQSIIPGHGCQEAVSVSVVMYTKGYSPVTLGCCSVTYKQNLSCKLSHFLVSHFDCVTSTSHQTLLSKFGLTVEDLQSLDHDMMLAIAHEELPPTWNILGNCSEDESNRKETLLHLTGRLGLVKLSRFLLSQPGGPLALALPNEGGAIPLDLASQNGHSRLVEIFMNFQGSHSFDISRAEISECAFLQFVHSSGTLTLTFNHTAEHLLESDIKLFRKYFWDRTFLYKSLNSKQAGTVEGPQMPCNSTDSAEDPMNLASDEPAPGSEDVKPFRDPVVSSSENEDQVLLDIEQRHSTLDVLKKSPNPPTFFAAATLTAMLNGSDEVYANCMVVDQVGDLDVNYVNIDSVTTETSTDQTHSSLTPKSSSSASLKESNQYIYAENEDNQMAINNIDSVGSQPFTSPSNLYAAGSYQPLKSRGFNKERSQLYADMKKRSSSLDDLEVDSGNEGISDRSHIRYPSLNSSVTLAGSRHELDSSETSTDLDYSIHRMDSNNLQSKESLLSGIRSRSYSCSSPKLLLGKSRFARDFTVCDSNEEQRAYSLPEQLKEKRIQEEEWDKYIIPTKSESEKYKVSRTFSFLMNRMTSTRNKCKTKNKDAKDKLNRHQFITGNFSGSILCMACDKALLGKESLQCSYCNAIVHKNCKDCAPACTKKPQERYHIKTRPQAVLTNSSFRDIPQPMFSSMHPSSSMPIGLSAVRKEVSQQPHSLSKSVPSASFERRSMPSSDQDTDSSSWMSSSQSETLLQSIGTLPSMDSFVMEDDVDASLWTDLSTESQEFEAESWSLVVDPAFCSKQEKDVIKRQDVIFELMQTEVHHIHTLFIMSEIFRKGMKEELQLDHSTVDKIFPCLDELLEIHRQFFCAMKERRQESCEGGNERNFVINRIGDILVQQFSEENANKMKKIYGEFCSHQKEAVNLFKELQQNKKFQNFIKLRNSNLLARRRGIPECILLVTQRITKYPVLVERILQYSKEGTEEHKALCKAHCLIKDMIAAVDLKVNEYEKRQKLLEILNKIENKTYTKLKNGHVFRKQDLKKKERTLLQEGLVYWKTATGRFKDSLALLLTDVLLFLQEKDQKYIFAAVDQKPSVISLQKLIVREVANEERGMFLISASSAGPEMYEIHTNSKEERNNWMRQIQDAVESCPEEEGKISESDEDRRIAEAKAAKIQQCQESLSNQDQQICSYLEDKLHIYAELGDMSGFEDVHVEPHLLIKPDSGEMPQASSLLAAALREAESLHFAVTSSQANDTNQSSEESTGEPSLTHTLSANEIFEAPTLTEIKGDEESCDFSPRICHAVNEVAGSLMGDKVECMNFSRSTPTEIVQAIQNLTRLLYSIQAALTIQDSHVEIHKILLQEHEGTNRGHSSRGNLLLDQEKYRNLEKQREELANIHKLQQQFQQEQQRWSRECDQQQREQEIRENQLQERERDCLCQEELLHRNRGELELQLQEFQQNVERLREGQRMVEKERDNVKMQQKILWHWKHSRQSSLPAAFPSSGSSEIIGHNQSESLCAENSFFINEALVQMSLNSLNRSNPSLVYQDGVYGINITSSDITRTSENQPAVTNELWKSTAPCHQVSSSCKSNKDACNNDLTASQIPCPRTHSLNPGCIQAQPLADVLLVNPQSHSSQDAENGARVEENIVYL